MKFCSQLETFKPKKIIQLFLAFIAFCSILLFCPFIRNFVINIGNGLNKTLNADFWHKKLLNIGLTLFGASSVTYVACYTKIKSALQDELLKKIVFSITIVYSVVYILLACVSDDIWLDEADSLAICSHSVPDIISITAKDVHPPLYYIVLKPVLMATNYSISAAKVFSAFAFIAALFMGMFFLIKEFNAGAALFFIVFVCGSDYMVFYTHEIRMYSFAFLFLMLVIIEQFYILKTKKLKHFIGYILAAELVAYNQYMAAVAVICNFGLLIIYLLIVDRTCIKKILIAIAIGIVLYCPWAMTVIKQIEAINHNFWIEPVSKRTLLECYKAMGFSVEPKALRLCLSFFMWGSFAFAIIQYFIKQQHKNIFVLILLLTPVLQIIALLLFSELFQPVLYVRYIVPSLSFTAIYFAIMFSKINFKELKAFVFVLLIFSSFYHIKNSFDYEIEMSKIFDEQKFSMIENFVNNSGWDFFYE